MSIFRDTQVRVALLALYALAALCLCLAHAERVFADPSMDRTSFCLSSADAKDGETGLPECGLCAEAIGEAPLLVVSDAPLERFAAGEPGPWYAQSRSEKQSVGPLGSRAPPFIS